MSGVDLGEFRTAFVLEAEELLTSANRQLLALDGSVRRGEPNVRAVRELFRAMHTIKGLSAMVGVEPVVALAHRMEAALRTADRRGGGFDLAAVDLMLTAVRAIDQRVQAVADRRDPDDVPADLLARLERIGEELATPTSPLAGGELRLEPDLAAKLSPIEREQLLQGVARGRRVVQIDFAPTPERADAGVTITSVRERVGQIADIVRVVPRSMPVTPATPGGLTFSVLLLSDASDPALLEASQVQASDLHVLATPTAEVAPELPSDAPRHGFVRVDVGRLDDAMERLSALVVTRFRLGRAAAALAARGADVRELGEVLRENASQLRALRAAILRVRLVPMAEVLERVPLLVRGLARTTGRSVDLDIDVGSTEVDKTVAERIFPAIVHLVRNAVDHAIEPPSERAQAGKPEQGKLRVSCVERSSSQLEIEVVDDGRGVDAEAVARRAGRPVPRNDSELLELLCLPGLSTRDQVTTTSGRGMGMDIVRRTIVDDLGGELMLETASGKGSRFILRVPLTVTIVDAFTFETAGERFCVPVASVEEIVDVDHARLVQGPSVDGTASLGMLERRGEAVPFVALARVLRRAVGPANKAFVVRRNGEPMAFAVERLLGQQEVVVRPLEDPLIRVAGITGATDLGDGRPTLVLDLYGLYAQAGVDGKEPRA